MRDCEVVNDWVALRKYLPPLVFAEACCSTDLGEYY